MTSQEVKIWVKLRELKALGSHFRRQAPIGNYVVDFVSFDRNLVIEVDGGQHNFASGIQRDRQRDRFLETRGFRVLRFWNSDVDNNLAGVIETIAAAVHGPPPRPPLHSADPPRKGEG